MTNQKETLLPLHRDVLYLLARGRTLTQVAETLQQPQEDVDGALAFLQSHFNVTDRRRLIVHAILKRRV